MPPPPAEFATHIAADGQEIALARSSTATDVTLHADLPPDGFVEVRILPPLAATHALTDGQETFARPRLAEKTCTSFQAEGPPVGLVELTMFPASSTATHRAVDGQEIPSSWAFPMALWLLSTCATCQVPGARNGSLELTTFPSASTATQSAGLGQAIAFGLTAAARRSTRQVRAPRAGAVETTNRPAPKYVVASPTHAETEGHDTPTGYKPLVLDNRAVRQLPRIAGWRLKTSFPRPSNPTHSDTAGHESAAMPTELRAPAVSISAGDDHANPGWAAATSFPPKTTSTATTSTLKGARTVKGLRRPIAG
jgi:hypothetical protein